MFGVACFSDIIQRSFCFVASRERVILSFVLGERLSLEPPARTLRMSGQTCSKVSSAANIHDWVLNIEGRVSITIRDAHWDNGERDLRPLMPDPMPAEMPMPLALLHGKRRAGIHKVPGGVDRAWMSVKTVRPGKNDWPSVTAPNLESLDAICGEELVRIALAQGGITLGSKAELLGAKDNDRTRNELRALFSSKRKSAPIPLYAVTRVVPTLKHICWI